MKKNFLLLLLLTLLPLAGWSADYYRVSVTNWTPSSSSTNFTGGGMALPTPTLQYRNSGSGPYQTLPASTYTVTWKYNGSQVVNVADHAGTYTATITPTSSSDSFYSNGGTTPFSVSYTYTINKVANTVSAPVFADGNTWEYGQTPHAPTATVLDGTPEFQISANGTSGWQSYSNLTVSSMPNTWYVRAHVPATVDYNETYSANTQIEITKATVTVIPGNETAEWRNPWGGMAMGDILNATVSSTLTDWSEAKSYLQWSQVEPVGDAEQGYAYTLESNGTSSDKFNFVVSGNGTVNIIKNTTGALKNVPTAGPDLVYDGTDQTLDPGTTIIFTDGQDNEAGTIEYSVDGGSTWTTTIPTGKDHGTYTIDVRGTGDQNHEDAVPASYTVYIDKATTPLPVITAVGGPFTYDAPDFDEDAFTVTKESDGALSYTYEFKAPGASTFAPATGFDGSAGTWKVYAHQAEGTNWYAMDDITGFEFEVAKAENEFTTDPEEVADWQYDAATHDLLSELGAVNGGATIHYHIIYTPFVGSGNYELDTDVMPTGKDAGTYQISYYAEECDNYLAIAETDLAVVTVSKADVTASGVAAKENVVYNGNPQSILKHGADAKTSYGYDLLTSEYSVSYEGGDPSPVSAYGDVKQTHAGEYTITYMVTPKDKNNINASAPVTVTAEILKAKLDIAAQKVEVDWTGTPVVLADEHYAKGDPTDFVAGEDEDEQYAIVNTLVQLKSIEGATTEKPIPTDAGNYEFELEPVTTDPTPCDYVINDFVPVSSLIINKIDPTPATVTVPDLTYNGGDQALLEVTGEVKIGETLYFVGEDAPAIPASLDNIGIEWTRDIPAKTDADTYKVWYMTKGDKNHNDIAPAYKEVTIKPKALDDKFFTLGPDNLVYNGADQKASVIVTAEDLQGTENIITTEDFEETKVEYKGAEVEKLINAGEYTFTFTGKKNYTGTAQATITIAQKELAADMFVFTDDVEYNGEFQKPTITTKDGEPIAATDYTFAVTYGDPATAIDYDKMVDADTYTFTFTATADGNYKDPADPVTVDWKITQKALDKSFFVLNEEGPVTFDGTDQIPGFELLATEPITTADFTFTTTNSDDEEVTVMVNADTYTYTFTAAADGNYSGEVEIPFVIEQATATIVKPTEIHLTYNNTDQALVTEGTTDAVAGTEPEDFAGLVEYQIVQDGETLVDWTDDYAAIVGHNAGVYTVNYRITASDVNYTNPLVEGSIDVTILKAEINYVLGNVTKDWDGETFDNDQINSLFTLHTGELFGEDKYDRPFDFVVPQDFKDAGEYTFTVSQKDVVFKEGYPVNYDVKVTGEAKLVINKVDIETTDFVAPEAATGLVYINGTAQDLIAEGYEVTTEYQFDGAEEATPIGTIVFATAEDGEYSETVPQGTDAGDYEIWWKVVGDKNHNDTEAQKIENTIAANATGFALAFEDDEWTYDGVEFYPEDVNAYDGEGEDAIATKKGTDYDFALTKDGEAFEGNLKDAGTYVFTYTGKGNYEGSSAEATIVITPKNIADADVTVALSAETAEFNNEDQKPTYTLTYAPAEKPALTLAEGEDKDFTVDAEAEMIAGGEYTFTFTGKGNYTGTKTATFNITKRVVIAQAEDVEKVYNSLFGLELPGDKEVEVPITWGNLVPGDTNVPTLGEGAITVEPYKNAVGKYTIIVDGSKFESANYEVKKGQREAFLTITPAPLTVKWDNQEAYKVYGTADPDLHNHVVLEGAQGGDGEGLAAYTQITRAEGENVDKYDVTLAAGTSDAAQKLFANYDVTFVPAAKAFEIKKAELTVSLTPQKVAYTGVKAVLDELTAEDLLVNGLVVNPALGINDYKDVVTTMPEIIVPDDAINVGSYELKFKEGTGDAANYKFNFLNATLDIEAFDISKAVVTIPEQQVRVGDVAEDVIKADGFTVELEGFTDVNAAEFQVVAADRFVDADGKIKNGDNPEKGLVLVPVDATAQKNYTGWENDAFTGNLIIVGAASLLLDDSQDIATTAQNGVDVTFTSRKINQDTWNVVCLPFDATIKEISEAFGYAAVDLLKRDSSDGSMHFIITSSGTVPAGEPFIVKPTSDEELNAKSNFNQITFYGVNVKAYTGNPEPVKDSAGNKFCGTFKAQTTIKGENFWYMSKGMWKHSVEKPVNIAAYRAYLETATADARIFIEEPDGSITAIDAIDFAKAETGEGWYTINGMKLDAAPTQKGTYIKDGKKVFVK